MTKQTKVLRMAIKTLSWYDDKEVVLETIGYCDEALAETQEPMTHVIGLDNDGKEVVVKLQTPLYTSPPSREWVGLSDEEIYPMADVCYSEFEGVMGKGFVFDRYKFARAIDVALREKNEK